MHDFKKFIFALAIMLIAWPSFSLANTITSKGRVSAEKEQEIKKRLANLHIPFIKNQGQTDKKVAYYVNTFAGTAFILKNGEIVYALHEAPAKDNRPSSTFEKEGKEGAFKEVKTITLKEHLVGADIRRVKGSDKAETQISSFIGNDKTRWRTNVPSYEVVNMGEIYDGIQFKLKAHGKIVDKFFYIKPGAKPDQIQISLEGAKKIRINEKGELEAETELGAMTFTKPVAYQVADGKRVEVEAEYAVGANHDLPLLSYGYKLGTYDTGKELIIDPSIQSTYLGGSSNDYANALAIDSGGNVYVAGATYSIDFPGTTGGVQTTNSGINPTFIAKLNSSLTNIIQSTYLGGSAGNHNAYALAIDSSANVYVPGYTASTAFPGTTGGAQSV
ncbi:MAG: SBBP repeat-containing protein, partial [Pseudomonadota bacterium]